MLDKAKTVLGVLVLGLLLGVVAVRYGPTVWKLLPVVNAEVKLAAIIGESNQGMTKEQLLVIQTAPDHDVLVLDRDIVGKDRKPPPELVPLLNAVKGETAYKLVILRTSGRVDVYPIPATPDELKGLLK